MAANLLGSTSLKAKNKPADAKRNSSNSQELTQISPKIDFFHFAISDKNVVSERLNIFLKNGSPATKTETHAIMPGHSYQEETLFLQEFTMSRNPPTIQTRTALQLQRMQRIQPSHRATECLFSATCSPAVSMRKASHSERKLHVAPNKNACHAKSHFVWRLLGLTLTWLWHLLGLILDLTFTLGWLDAWHFTWLYTCLAWLLLGLTLIWPFGFTLNWLWHLFGFDTYILGFAVPWVDSSSAWHLLGFDTSLRLTLSWFCHLLGLTCLVSALHLVLTLTWLDNVLALTLHLAWHLLELTLHSAWQFDTYLVSAWFDMNYVRSHFLWICNSEFSTKLPSIMYIRIFHYCTWPWLEPFYGQKFNINDGNPKLHHRVNITIYNVDINYLSRC